MEGHFHSAARGGRSHPSSPPLAQVIGPAARSLGLDSGSSDIQLTASKLPRAAKRSPIRRHELSGLSRTASSRGLLRPQRAGPGRDSGFLRPLARPPLPDAAGRGAPTRACARASPPGPRAAHGAAAARGAILTTGAMAAEEAEREGGALRRREEPAAHSARKEPGNFNRSGLASRSPFPTT